MKGNTLATCIFAAVSMIGSATANDALCSIEIDRINSGLVEYDRYSSDLRVLNVAEQEILLRQKVGKDFPAECVDEISNEKLYADVLRTSNGFSISGGKAGHRYGFTITSAGAVEDLYVIFK